MATTLTRLGFLRRAAGGAAGAVVAGSAISPAGARAATALDASFTSPYAPHPVIGHPSSWFVYTALMPGVVMPYDVVVSNRELEPLRDIDGGPDLSSVPSDATMLMLCLYDPVPREDVTNPDLFTMAISINESNMHFTDLGAGVVNWQGFRQFLGWHVAILGDMVHSIETRAYVGPNAGSEWADVQSVVDSVHLPS